MWVSNESDMKTRHKLTLASYLNYGEGYSSGINYDEESLKSVIMAENWQLDPPNDETRQNNNNTI